MERDNHYETFDGRCYVNVRIMETSPLYGVSTDILPLFCGGKVLVVSSNIQRKAPPSLALNKDFYKKWKESEDNKLLSKSTKWYFSFTAKDRWEADKAIDQIYELEGMSKKERDVILKCSTLIYRKHDINKRLSKSYKEQTSSLISVSEMSMSLDIDPYQESEIALNLSKPKGKSKFILSSLFKKGQYENFAIRLLCLEDESEVVVKIKNSKFWWSNIKYKNPSGDIVEREPYEY